MIAKASEKSSNAKVWKAIDVLSRIFHVCHKIVLDPSNPNQDNIIDEYERQARSEVTKRWLISMQTRQKIKYRSRAPIILPILSDPDDLKYFQVASNSPHKVIVSEDSDLTRIANNRQITSKGIAIWTLDDALNNL